MPIPIDGFCCWFFLTSGPAFAADYRNLLANPDLAGGNGTAPDDWSQLPKGKPTGFEWHHREGTPAELILQDTSSAFGPVFVMVLAIGCPFFPGSRSRQFKVSIEAAL